MGGAMVTGQTPFSMHTAGQAPGVGRGLYNTSSSLNRVTLGGCARPPPLLPGKLPDSPNWAGG